MSGEPRVTAAGTQVWRNADGRLHRDGDLPAVIMADGTQLWFVDGLRHREGRKPAAIWADGRESWWWRGSRIDAPRTSLA